MIIPGISDLTVNKKIPIHVFFELTRNCNLNCIHCYIVKEKKLELSTSKIREVIAQLKNQNSLILNFSGGEVLLRRDFFEIARYARKEGFALKIFSNGVLIDKNKADEIAELNPLRVEITIFSVYAQIHDSITRVKGSLAKSLRALKLLEERKVPLRIKCPLMKQNVSGFRQIIRLADKLRAKYQFDMDILPKINGDKDILKYQINENEVNRILRNPRISINESFIPDEIRRSKKTVFCSAAHNSCAVTAYGDVLPCIAFPINLGNVKEQAFSDIWRSSGKLRQIRSAKLKDHKYCFKCGLLIYCNKCQGYAYLNNNGNVFGKSERACMLAGIRRNIAHAKA